MGKAKSRPQRPSKRRIVVGVAWYSPHQWGRLREVSADRDQLEQTYEQWKATYERATRDLVATDVTLRKVPIEMDELEKWCRERKLPIDADARAQYVLETVQRDHESLEQILPDTSPESE